MDEPRSWKQYGAIVFFVLTVVWSWAWWWPLWTLPGGTESGFPVNAAANIILGTLGPSLMGILLTLLGGGKGNLRAMWGPSGPPGRWSAYALLIVPAITLAKLALITVFGVPYTMGSLATKLSFLPLAFVAPLSEEFGWRGFALPSLQKRLTPLVSAVIIGLVWGFWHLPVDYWGTHVSLGPLFWVNFLLFGPILLTALAVLMAWIYNRSGGSMLLMLLFHFSITASAILLDPTLPTAGWSTAANALSAALAWVSALAVIRSGMGKPVG